MTFAVNQGCCKGYWWESMAMAMPLASRMVSMMGGNTFTQRCRSRAGYLIIQKNRMTKKMVVMVTMLT